MYKSLTLFALLAAVSSNTLNLNHIASSKLAKISAHKQATTTGYGGDCFDSDNFDSSFGAVEVYDMTEMDGDGDGDGGKGGKGGKGGSGGKGKGKSGGMSGGGMSGGDSSDDYSAFYDSPDFTATYSCDEWYCYIIHDMCMGNQVCVAMLYCRIGDMQCFSDQACAFDDTCASDASACDLDDKACLFEAICSGDDMEFHCAAYMYCDENDQDCAQMSICLMDPMCYIGLEVISACLDLGANEVCMMGMLCDTQDYECAAYFGCMNNEDCYDTAIACKTDTTCLSDDICADGDYQAPCEAWFNCKDSTCASKAMCPYAGDYQSQCEMVLTGSGDHNMTDNSTDMGMDFNLIAGVTLYGMYFGDGTSTYCDHSHLYRFAYGAVTPIFNGMTADQLIVTSAAMKGSDMASCAVDEKATGKALASETLVSPGTPCGYYVTYEWTGNGPVFFAIVSDNAMTILASAVSAYLFALQF